MITVPRHATDSEHAMRQVETLSPEVVEWLDRLPDKPLALAYLRDTLLMLAGYRCVLDPAAAERETWEDLGLAAQASAAMFAGPPGDTVEVRIGRQVRFTAPVPGSKANAGAWKSAVWYAVAAGNDDLVAHLCEIAPDTLRASGVEHDDYVYPWVASIRAFLRKEVVPASTFIAAMDGTDPDRARITPRDTMLLLVYPPIKMFYCLLRRDPNKFNEALSNALDAHRRWWTTADRADNPDGFVAIEPLAIAILALKAGMPVTVSSEYLPENLLRGRR